MIQAYGPLLSELGFVASDFDDAEIFLIAGTILREEDLYNRAVNEKLVAGVLPAGARQKIISEMSEAERLALRQRVIDGNRWLAEKLSPRKTRRGPAVTAF